MVQFKVLSGRLAGTERVAHRFPFRIGRAAAADLRLEDDGVWEEHLEVALDPAAGFALTAHSDAFSTVNGQPFQRVILRNGDAIELGAARLRFWLAQTRQKSLRLREWLTWTAFALITAGQLGLIYWLLR